MINAKKIISSFPIFYKAYMIVFNKHDKFDEGLNQQANAQDYMFGLFHRIISGYDLEIFTKKLLQFEIMYNFCV